MNYSDPSLGREIFERREAERVANGQPALAAEAHRIRDLRAERFPGSRTEPIAGMTEPIEGMPRLWRAGDLKPAAQPRWLARNRMPRRSVSLLIGDEGIGKSLWWVLVVAAVTTGKAVPEMGIPAREPDDVILVLTEDTWSEDVLPRLLVAVSGHRPDPRDLYGSGRIGCTCVPEGHLHHP